MTGKKPNIDILDGLNSRSVKYNLRVRSEKQTNIIDLSHLLRYLKIFWWRQNNDLMFYVIISRAYLKIHFIKDSDGLGLYSILTSGFQVLITEK